MKYVLIVTLTSDETITFVFLTFNDASIGLFYTLRNPVDTQSRSAFSVIINDLFFMNMPIGN